MNVEQVLQEYQDEYHAIIEIHGLDYLNAARAGMIVCSVIFNCHVTRAKEIDPYVAAGIIAMGLARIG